MATGYTALPYRSLKPHGHLQRPTYVKPGTVALDDPAHVVMTDLHQVVPFTIEPTASISAVNDTMIACGVRLLFVVGGDGSLQGLITATDILGEKPLKHVQARGVTYEEIRVEDIMTPAAALEVLHLEDVERASVGDIVETMRAFGRQHALVVETLPDGDVDLICGIFSTTRIYRQLGIQPEAVTRPKTFLEVEERLVSGY